MASPNKIPPPASRNSSPLIPEKYLDAPSQRLYCLSIGLLIQAIKLVDIFRHFSSSDANTLTYAKWMLVDFTYCVVLSRLRVPRLNYGKSVVLLQIISLWLLDGFIFGGISLNLAARSHADGASSTESFSMLGLLSFGLLPTTSSARNSHLLGQHTVRMSPISTARLNADGQTFCLNKNSVLIPILLNNTNPSALRYSITPLGYTEDGANGKTEYFDLSAKDLKALEQSHIQSLQLTKTPASKNAEADDYDEYDDDDDKEESTGSQSHSNLQRTQSLIHIKVGKPGTLRLERVGDASNVDARLGYPTELLIVPCPNVEFMTESSAEEDGVRCARQNLDLQLMINIQGVPPLSLRWFKAINGAREPFLVEGIEGSPTDTGDKHDVAPESATDVLSKQMLGQRYIPQELKVPLAVSLDALGTHLYVLEEIMDAVGNVVRVGSSAEVDSTANLNTKTTRSLVVLRRPTVSFKGCGPGHPASLRIGSEASLTLAASQADLLDAPWDVVVKYQPLAENAKQYKPWTKTLKTQGTRKDLQVRADAPGEYTVVDIKGKWCEGDVLAPESCRVIEQPLPSAEIEWKKIHECSGDTGVAASLVLHGTKPFNVKFTSQRDKEPPREMFKMFDSSRAEFTHQPERSGHYTYTFLEISDANYKKVPLNGPSIDQIVHPLAAAAFASSNTGAGRTKKSISSCEGNLASVDVELRGTGPWNLEVQIVGPRGSEILSFPGIATAKKTLQIPVPEDVDRDGGTFEIDLVSVEDKYKCRRSITAPGVSVNVRRIKPTVRFYGQADKRHVTVLEKERADLPLRLTGEGPWRIRYRLLEDGRKIQTATLTSPNDHLHVYDQGTYEILEIKDSQCPGFVIAEGSTFEVAWLQRPSARLSPKVNAQQSQNGSYTLPSICENLDEYVDLELTGRPPFQIVYNIAKGEAGRTTILDQPTFNSIQPRTRFQLQTSSPGRMHYEVKQLGDAAYPLAKHKNAVLPLSKRLLFEQEVMMRPLAHFKNRNRVSYCLNDLFVPRDALSADAVVVLEGTPPFTLTLSIRNVAASQVQTRTVELTEAVWKLDLPSYPFHSIGPHLVTIESVTDSSKCAPAALDPHTSSIWVDVAETAAIVPFDRRENVCVGETSQFQLEGTPPWTIGYRINGKYLTQETWNSPFSVAQRQPGEFAITSIAHQQTMCKAAVTDLRLQVHQLPSAQVGHGKRVFQDIHEGDQAEIVFTLIGEPPFTFTYQRSEASSKKGGRTGRVLETHTVSRVSAKEYSIFSALEGTWEVTSISDRYCRYPQAQPDEQRH